MVTVIDCAYDNDIAKDLSKYLSKQGFDTRIEESLVILTNAKNIKKYLDIFIKDSKREGYNALQVKPEIFLISKVVSIEKLAVRKCGMCGLVGPEADLLSHRWAHGTGY